MGHFDLANLYEGYDPNSIDTSKRGERPDPIPAGEYMVQIIDAVRRVKENGNASILLTFEVMSGEFERRKLWENLNIRHSSPMAQKISLEAYTELWRDAIKMNPPSVEDDLIGHTIIARVRVEKHKDTGEMQNKIVKYLPAQHGGSAPRPQASTPAATQQQSGNRPAFLKR